MLRNVLKVELVEDPQEPVQAILDRMDPKYLAEVYDIPELPSRDVQDFLLRLAYQKGRIARGALPDLDGTARSVLHDWNTGKIKYQTEPPAKHPSLVKPTKPVEAAPAGDGSAAILSSFSEEFDLAGLLGEADAEVLGGDGRYSPPPPDPVPVPGTLDIGADVDDVTDSTLGKRERDDSDSDEDMTSYRTRRPSAWGVLDVEGDDEDEDDLPEAPPPPKKAAPKPMFNEAESEGMAPSRGKERRKARKEKKRRQGLAQTMDTLMDLDAGMATVEPAPASDEEEEL